MVNPGQTVSLVCITTGGEPPPMLTWISSNDSLPQRSVVNGGTLTLPAITSEEAGPYSCVASNNVGNPAKKSTTIVVRGEGDAYGHIYHPLQQVSFMLGTLISFKLRPKHLYLDRSHHTDRQLGPLQAEEARWRHLHRRSTLPEKSTISAQLQD